MDLLPQYISRDVEQSPPDSLLCPPENSREREDRKEKLRTSSNPLSRPWGSSWPKTPTHPHSIHPLLSPNITKRERGGWGSICTEGVVRGVGQRHKKVTPRKERGGVPFHPIFCWFLRSCMTFLSLSRMQNSPLNAVVFAII